jgi:hypothetical protein
MAYAKADTVECISEFKIDSSEDILNHSSPSCIGAGLSHGVRTLAECGQAHKCRQQHQLRLDYRLLMTHYKAHNVEFPASKRGSGNAGKGN